MNYEQKYKESLERANEAVKRGMVSQNFVDDIFGMESEDEEIVGLIKKVLYDCKNGTEHAIGDKDYSKCIAWIESNSGCCGEINDEALQEQYEIWIEKGRCSGRDEVIFHPEKFGLCKPAEWSEEDEKMRKDTLRSLECYQKMFTSERVIEDVNDEIFWLKSLRPQPKGKWAKRLEEAQARWKPSEDDLDAFKELIDDANKRGWVTPGVSRLYEQLKALM